MLILPPPLTPIIIVLQPQAPSAALRLGAGGVQRGERVRQADLREGVRGAPGALSLPCRPHPRRQQLQARLRTGARGQSPLWHGDALHQGKLTIRISLAHFGLFLLLLLTDFVLLHLSICPFRFLAAAVASSACPSARASTRRWSSATVAVPRGRPARRTRDRRRRRTRCSEGPPTTCDVYNCRFAPFHHHQQQQHQNSTSCKPSSVVPLIPCFRFVFVFFWIAFLVCRPFSSSSSSSSSFTRSLSIPFPVCIDCGVSEQTHNNAPPPPPSPLNKWSSWR